MRFIERLFGKSEPPQGLEGFTGQLQQRINNHLTAQRQQELERRNSEAARISAEAKEQAKAAEEQRKLESQERIRKEKAIAEGSRILQEFQIAERLKIIQQTAWEGKGRIRPIEPDGIDILGGFELAHQYSSYKREEKRLSEHSGYWRFVPDTDSTRLVVKVLGRRWHYRHYTKFSRPECDITVENGRFLEIKSYTTESLKHTDKGIVIPVDENDSKALLEEALLQDTNDRIVNQGLPSQVEKQAWEKRSRLPHWKEWIYYSDTRHGG